MSILSLFDSVCVCVCVEAKSIKLANRNYKIGNVKNTETIISLGLDLFLHAVPYQTIDMHSIVKKKR